MFSLVEIWPLWHLQDEGQNIKGGKGEYFELASFYRCSVSNLQVSAGGSLSFSFCFHVHAIHLFFFWFVQFNAASVCIRKLIILTAVCCVFAVLLTVHLSTPSATHVWKLNCFIAFSNVWWTNKQKKAALEQKGVVKNVFYNGTANSAAYTWLEKRTLPTCVSRSRLFLEGFVSPPRSCVCKDALLVLNSFKMFSNARNLHQSVEKPSVKQ